MTKPISIHYWRGDVKKPYPARTGCGVKIRDLPKEARLVNDLESVDCADCLSSDECKAQAMEDSFKKPRLDSFQITGAAAASAALTSPGIFPAQMELHGRVVPAPSARARRRKGDGPAR